MKALRRSVEVAREGDVWVAQVGPDSTYARSLAKLRQYVREVIILQDDLPEGADPGFDFTLPQTHSAGRFIDAAVQARAAAETATTVATAALCEAVMRMSAEHISDRDAGELLNLSFQRVHQIRRGGAS